VPLRQSTDAGGLERLPRRCAIPACWNWLAFFTLFALALVLAALIFRQAQGRTSKNLPRSFLRRPLTSVAILLLARLIFYLGTYQINVTGAGVQMLDYAVDVVSGVAVVWIVWIGEWRAVGRVESIGMRSTKIRKLDRSLIAIPNADFAQRYILNVNSCDRFLLATTLDLRYETRDDQLRYLLAELRELPHAHPMTIHTATDPERVRFVGFGD
jgi:hypothetical protein